MYKVSAKIIGTSPLLFSAPILSIKDNETDENFERRVWKERAHRNKDGNVCIPGIAIKNMMIFISGYLKEKIRGQGNSQYKGKFVSGVRCPQSMIELKDYDDKPIHIDDVACLRAFVPSDGRKGGGRRVWKHFPRVDEWTANIEILVLDEIIAQQKIEEYLRAAGMFGGLGMWRPGSSGGDNGTFVVDDDSVRADEITI
jgi:hypothetical protein